MSVRQGIGALLAISVVFTGMALSKAQAKKEEPALRVSLAIPQLCNGQDGQPVLPRFLPFRYTNEQFAVVVENVSDKPLQLWAEGNSLGDATLTFEITGPDGKTTRVRPVGQAYGKNIFRTERLLPGETWVRNIRYNAASPQWDGFPSPAAGKPYKATVQAILTQTPVANSKNPELWMGKVVSLPQDIIFER